MAGSYWLKQGLVRWGLHGVTVGIEGEEKVFPWFSQNSWGLDPRLSTPANIRRLPEGRACFTLFHTIMHLLTQDIVLAILRDDECIMMAPNSSQIAPLVGGWGS